MRGLKYSDLSGRRKLGIMDKSWFSRSGRIRGVVALLFYKCLLGFGLHCAQTKKRYRASEL